jgi:hypothetical protein
VIIEKWEEGVMPAEEDPSAAQEVDEVTSVFKSPRKRPHTQPCPMCGMRNALSDTEVRSGYLCEECAGAGGGDAS